MCGNKKCREILIKGLKRLEYRGYDSAGIAIIGRDSGKTARSTNLKIYVVKEAGKIRILEKEVNDSKIEGNCGIGHTRWATHGEPTKINAHPHLDGKGSIAVIHNGIIENYAELREELKKEGHKFISQTDTEVLPHLLEKYYDGDLLLAMQKVIKKIKGSGAIVAISAKNPGEIIGARITSPLVVGISDNGNFLASDMPAVLEYTRNFIVINDFETIRLTADKVEIFDGEGKPVKREPFKVDWDILSAEKSGYEDFMLKEIFEQPYGVKETMRGRLVDGKLNFDELDMTPEQIRSLKKVQIIACGTSSHAALIGKQVIEKWARIPVEVDFSSEYRYRDPLVEDNSLFVAITQSGETIDTLAAIREAKSKGAKIVAITNVVGSTVARESNSVIYTPAGPEIGVCATKTYTAQIIVMYLMALYFARVKRLVDKNKFQRIIGQLETIPDKIQNILERADEIKKIADKTYKHTCFLFLGRIFGLPTALEGALKLKEISYIHAEGYPAGEMKHGPIALTDSKTVVVGIMPHDSVYEKILSNIQEVKARKATIFSIISESDKNTQKYSDYIFRIPEALEELYAILTIIPIQLYSYYIAKDLNRNVDQPRNLAKSVTVE
ncbi:MAG TPA: glutamine--fructose-6-phosphate transaminase (isomerizing) [Candidatus Humimicrobiaceae bacterium]|nr:glutamine--fructose-6-phosphate transaminase (isomerizing) [Candidatus Humimicrobiaceae bacterium]